jgi:hypothetical protein
MGTRRIKNYLKTQEKKGQVVFYFVLFLLLLCMMCVLVVYALTFKVKKEMTNIKEPEFQYIIDLGDTLWVKPGYENERIKLYKKKKPTKYNYNEKI